MDARSCLRWRSVGWLLVVLVTLSLPGVAFADAPSRVALVIGNGAYRTLPALPNPPNDARAIGAALQSLGFSVEVGTDLTRDAMDEALIGFTRKARRADVALVFFGGHGIQYRGVNYLAPVDAKVQDEDDLPRFITAQQVLQDLQAASKIRILVLDACRDSDVVAKLTASLPASRSAGLSRGLSRMSAPEGTLLAFSTQADSVAADGSDADSPFVTALLKHLAEPGVDVRLVFARARADVFEATHHTQLPELSDSLVGEFSFKDAASAPDQPASAEAVEWSIIRNSVDPNLFEGFVTRYPESALRAQAEARLADLRKVQTATLPAAPTLPIPVPPVVTPPSPAAGGDDTVARLETTPDPTVGACDRLAASPSDTTRPADVAGVEFGALDASQAVAACSTAYQFNVDNPRIAFQYARALEKAGRAEAVAFYRLAANGGSLAAMASLGAMYENGSGVAKDLEEAARWYRKGADGGSDLAKTQLDRLLRTSGQASEGDHVAVARRAADGGDPQAMVNLGQIYETGNGLSQDLAEAANWYRRAADGGNALGMAYLGFMYENGRGVTRDLDEALRWYRKGADANNDFAKTQLDRLASSATPIDGDDNAAVARRAAEGGDPQAMVNLGQIYETGNGVAQDLTEAAEWYRKAADGGNALGMAYLGFMYENGRGVVRDLDEAQRWYRKGADADNDFAKTQLDRIAGSGTPGNEDDNAAVARRAAEGGDPQAMVNLGQIYETGNGLAQDLAEAANWYRKAADGGSTLGMAYLGFMYENGRGVPKSRTEALRWYRKAAQGGNAFAQGQMTRLR